MIDNRPPDEDEETTIRSESAVIYPLVASSGNERVLKEWLTDHETYSLAEEGLSLTEAEFDLCIVDEEGLEEHKTELERVRSESRPVLLPVLLLLSERGSDIIETDRGEIADNVLVSTVDEIVSLPMRQAELEWRLHALLRLRNQSLELRAKTSELERFREAVEASGHAIFITDPDGTLEYVNPAFEDITGYTEEEVLGETPRILNSGEMPAEFYEELWETITSGEIWEAEIVDRAKDGSLYTAYQTIAPITDDDGEVNAYVAVQTDITERKELQDRLKRHRDIVQRLEDPIMLQDENGAFRLVNEALTDFAGLSEEELLGEDEHLFMDDEAAARIQRHKADVLDDETAVNYSISPTFERSDREGTFSTRRYPYYDENDELAGTIAICRDVTDLETRTRQLRVLDNILRHNLRNDLTVVRGLADEIGSQTAGEIADTADEIVRKVNKLMSTGEKSRSITDLLSEEPKRKPIDITTTVRSIAAEFAADRSDVRIDVAAPERLVVDTTLKIREAIEELVRNAIIHNDRKQPSIELRVEADGETVEIHVLDNGPGIPEMDRDVLETGRAIDDLYHGSGLGLWLVYWIVNRSDGSIEVEDANSRGTEVTMRLPRVPDERV
jgi:PAS domain S-box-containing protein